MMKTRPKINAEFYLAVAENSVNENAFRPGDILRSRSGKTVEIHNTDEEGRVVLADALSVAAEQ
jgi:leucyl aminopeptidase